MDIQQVLMAIATGKRVYATVIDPEGNNVGSVRVPTPAYLKDKREKGYTLTDFFIGSDTIHIGRA